MTQKEFYQTQQWKRARRAFILHRRAIDGGLCQTCGERPGVIVHHNSIWLNDSNCNDPAIALNEANFKLDCIECHNKEKDPAKCTPGRVTYGLNGEILQR